MTAFERQFCNAYVGNGGVGVGPTWNYGQTKSGQLLATMPAPRRQKPTSGMNWRGCTRDNR